MILCSNDTLEMGLNFKNIYISILYYLYIILLSVYQYQTLLLLLHTYLLYSVSLMSWNIII